MAFVICEPCVGVKNGNCLQVCPVNAIHPLPNETDYPVEPQLYIHPDLCTDCSLCKDACPVGAIYELSNVPLVWQQYIGFNRDYYGL